MHNDRSVSLYSVKMAATLTHCPYLISSPSSKFVSPYHKKWSPNHKTIYLLSNLIKQYMIYNCTFLHLLKHGTKINTSVIQMLLATLSITINTFSITVVDIILH